jgi:acyl-CoA synthetase (AMP-forming)/AMP-acid ligase II
MTKQCAVSDETQTVGLSVLPFFHIYGFNGILNSSLLEGTHMVSLSKFTPQDYINCVVKFKVTVKQVITSIHLRYLMFLW